jgi:uroporphyrinogen-III decarboxylase
MKLWVRFDAIKLTKEMLNDEVPLIGFAVHHGQFFVMLKARSKSFDTERILFL